MTDRPCFIHSYSIRVVGVVWIHGVQHDVRGRHEDSDAHVRRRLWSHV